MKPFKNFELLTDREKDVIRVTYLGMKNNLGLSPEYFEENLHSARAKLGMDSDGRFTNWKKKFK